MKNNVNIAIIVPAHNEGKVLGKTLLSLLRVLPEEHIYVINDGSTDNTDNVARLLVSNVLTLPNSHGKAGATNRGIAYFDILEKYKYVMPIDADTVISRKFLKHALPVLEKDTKKTIACLVGKVNGRKKNWITAYRIWEYEVTQTVHKTAQSAENAVMICTGCATVYRTEILKQVAIPEGTLTEDMDLTFLIHREKLGRIIYVDKATVITQDPGTIKDLMKQLNRWYTGFWQCVIKHNIPWGGQPLDFEVGIIAVEGLFNGLLVVFGLVFIPFILRTHPLIIAIPATVDLFLFLLPTMLYTAIKNKMFGILLYIPHFYFLRFFSSYLFLVSFIKMTFSRDISMQWQKVMRY